MIELERVSTYYRNFEAIQQISLEVKQGELVALIGSNGAGKTTVLRTICGLSKPKSGRIRFQGEDITSWDVIRRVKHGIVYCPEGRKLFPEMTVRENLEMGAYLCEKTLTSSLTRVFDLFPVLKDRQSQVAGALSGGQQQMLAIGRTLMAEPQLVLFDEPAVGLAPIVVNELMRVIQQLNAGNLTVLLVEQNVNFALEISDRAYILENGKIVLEGPAEALKKDPKVKVSYLGG